jgi:uncharacterized protein YecT (DUF1311 family)
MPISRVPLALLLVAVTAVTAFSQSQNPRPQGGRQKTTTPAKPAAKRDPCATRVTQLDFTECAQQTASQADATLKKVYAALLKDLDDEHRPILANAEKAWETFREAECELDASANLHGSMYPQVFDDCLAGMADSRVTDLQQTRKDLADFLR